MKSISRFQPDTRVGHHSGQLAAEIDGQVVAMGLNQGQYVGFNDIATTIWHRLAQPCRVADLCTGLAQDFDGDPLVIQQDVCSLLGVLHDLELIVVIPDTDIVVAPSAPIQGVVTQ